MFPGSRLNLKTSYVAWSVIWLDIWSPLWYSISEPVRTFVLSVASWLFDDFFFLLQTKRCTKSFQPLKAWIAKKNLRKSEALYRTKKEFKGYCFPGGKNDFNRHLKFRVSKRWSETKRTKVYSTKKFFLYFTWLCGSWKPKRILEKKPFWKYESWFA